MNRFSALPKGRRLTWRGNADFDICTCLDCCRLDPKRLALREKRRGFGVFNGNRVDPASGKVVKP